MIDQLRKFRLISNNICFGPYPGHTDEVEQHLTVNSKGRVWLTRYVFGERGFPPVKSDYKRFCISPVKAQFLLDSIAKYFNNQYTEVFVTDVGDWSAVLTEESGREIKRTGPLCAASLEGVREISELIRDTLADKSLFSLDGNI